MLLYDDPNPKSELEEPACCCCCCSGERRFLENLLLLWTVDEIEYRDDAILSDESEAIEQSDLPVRAFLPPPPP
jgi:hypothetical protein